MPDSDFRCRRLARMWTLAVGRQGAAPPGISGMKTWDVTAGCTVVAGTSGDAGRRLGARSPWA